jgi:hypothetical protein
MGKKRGWKEVCGAINQSVANLESTNLFRSKFRPEFGPQDSQNESN